MNASTAAGSGLPVAGSGVVARCSATKSRTLPTGNSGTLFIAVRQVLPSRAVRSRARLRGAGTPSGAYGQPTASAKRPNTGVRPDANSARSEEQTSELQSLIRISYTDFSLKKRHKSEKGSQTPASKR